MTIMNHKHRIQTLYELSNCRRCIPVGIAYKHRDKNEAQNIAVVGVIELHVRAASLAGVVGETRKR